MASKQFNSGGYRTRLFSEEEAGGGLFSLLCSLLVIYGTAVCLTIAFSLIQLSITILIAWGIVVISLAAGVLYYRWIRPPAGPRLLSGLTPGERWLLGAGLFFYLLLWILAYILPDSENDGLWYHNPTLHFWALKERIHWIAVDYEPFWNDMIDYSWNGYMKGVEAIGFLFLRAVPVSRFLNGINLTIIPLGGLGLAALVRFVGGSRFSSILAAVLFLFVPNVICHAVNFYIGASVASFYIALFAVTALVIRVLTTGRSSRMLIPALGCALGLAVSAKGTAIVLFPLIPIILGIYWYRAAVSAPEKAAVLKRGAVFIVLVLLIALAVGGYWYIRNYIHTGTPLYPIGLRLAGRTIFPGVEIPFQFPPPDTPLTKHWSQISRVLYSWLDNPVEWHLALTEVSHNSGGLGLLWLFGCFPALIWFLILIIRRRGGEEGGWGLSAGTGPAWIGITILGLVLFFAMPPRHNHKVRYIIWIYGLGLPAFLLAAERIWRSSSRFRRHLGRIWIIVVLVVFLGEGIYSFGYQVKKISLSRQGVREGAFLIPQIIRAAREDYPSGYFLPELKDSLFRRVFQYQEPVAIGELNSFPEQREIVGHLTQGNSFGVRPIYFLDRDTASDPEKLSRFIRDRGIKFVVWNPDIPVPPALGEQVLLWDRVDRWYYLLVVDPDGVYPTVREGGDSS